MGAARYVHDHMHLKTAKLTKLTCQLPTLMPSSARSLQLVEKLISSFMVSRVPQISLASPSVSDIKLDFRRAVGISGELRSPPSPPIFHILFRIRRWVPSQVCIFGASSRQRITRKQLQLVSLSRSLTFAGSVVVGILGVIERLFESWIGKQVVSVVLSTETRNCS